MPRTGLPKDGSIAPDITELTDYWKERNDLYKDVQEHLERKHNITGQPPNTFYELRKLLLGRYRAHLNERLSRFTPVPRIRVVPEDVTPEAEHDATSLEKLIAEFWRQSSLTNDSWGLALTDVLTCEEGWQLYEPAIETAWPALIPGVDGKDAFEAALGATPEALEARTAYKKNRPIPVTSRYVPLNSVFAVPDSNVYEVYQVEYRSLQSVLGNERFSADAREYVRKSFSSGSRGIMQNVAILYYCNGDTYAYYAVGADDKSRSDGDVPTIDTRGLVGTPVLLHHYKHNIGENLYNPITGAHGGWNGGGAAFIKGRVKTLLDLETAIDSVFSQGLTNLGETFWPTLVIKRTLERPGSGIMLDPSDAELIGGVKRETGRDLEIYAGESVEPMIPPQPSSLYESQYNKLNQMFDMIAGSASLYGIHQPGVETGYQEENLRTQSESQYARVESGIAKGAITGTLKMLALCRETGEDVVIRKPVRKYGKQSYEETVISQEMLAVLPVLDASVRAPRPIDLPVQIKAYQEAVRPVNGPGTQAMSTRQARIDLLGDEHPDETLLMIRAEEEEQKFWASEIPQTIMSQKLGLRQLSEVAQSVTADANAAMEQDPGMASQLAAFINNEAPLAPSSTMEGSGQGHNGGLQTGVAQPEQTDGREQQIMGTLG